MSLVLASLVSLGEPFTEVEVRKTFSFLPRPSFTIWGRPIARPFRPRSRGRSTPGFSRTFASRRRPHRTPRRRLACILRRYRGYRGETSKAPFSFASRVVGERGRVLRAVTEGESAS